MPEICPKCGLPKEICVCDILDRETNRKIKVYLERKKFRKYMTVVSGLTGEELEKTAKELKKNPRLRRHVQERHNRAAGGAQGRREEGAPGPGLS